MLTLIMGTDWTANRKRIFQMLAQDVSAKRGKRILIVPELISHNTERRLCYAAGDTASRFAEVLSFTRLARRVADSVGHGALECLDNGGRVVAMASAARQLHSVLKAYAAVETRPEFLTGLIDMVDEFKRCCIGADDLRMAAQKTQGSFAQKLEELSLLLDAYDGQCQRGKRDPRDQMTWLLEQLQDGHFADEYVFYVDGFPDFTRQHMAILEHLILTSENVIISMNCDCPNSRNMAFEKAGKTAFELIQCAHRMGVSVSTEYVPIENTKLAAVRERMFHGTTERLLLQDHLVLYRTGSVHQEVTAAAERITALVQSGARYRDISVVCADMEGYRNTVSMVFKRCQIPAYISGTEGILEKPIILTVISAIDAVASGFELRDVIRYIKSMLSPLDLETCDKLENYAIMWGVNGIKWLQPFQNHPRGLGEAFEEDDILLLEELNQARIQALQPLKHLREGFSSARNLREQVLALYEYLVEINLSDRLLALADELDAAGENREAQILNQLWEILLNALEQMHDVLGNTVWDIDAFIRLIKLLLSQYDVGTIPPVLDSVTVGPVSAMRCQQVKHLIVLGALEGSLPGYGGSAGILSDQERVALRMLGVPLTGGAMDGLQNEFAEIYGVFCGAQETITVSFPGGQPSFLYCRLQKLAGGEHEAQYSLGAALSDCVEAGAYLARMNAENAAQALSLTDIYDEFLVKRKHNLGQISADTIRGLYGNTLRLSASQIDRLAECRLSYFLKYGMRAKERKPITVDPAEFGTFVHAVLEQTVRQIMIQGGFDKVSLEETLAIADNFAKGYVEERFAQLDTDRLVYLFDRNRNELMMIVRELWDELRTSEFLPVEYELSFGKDGKLPDIELYGDTMRGKLSGFVDRVDLWEHDGKAYFRVVDYKTGRKDFDYCDIFNGIGLQMLLYLFAIEHGGDALFGKLPIPAGVQYFPARAPFVTADCALSDEEADQLRAKTWKRKGLLLQNAAVLQAMDPDEMSVRLPVVRRKDGSVSGDLADCRQFELLKRYLVHSLKDMVNEIASGCVEPNPYTRGSSHDACAFCPYGEICHKNAVQGRRNYKLMTAQRFWDEVEREMKQDG